MLINRCVHMCLCFPYACEYTSVFMLDICMRVFLYLFIQSVDVNVRVHVVVCVWSRVCTHHYLVISYISYIIVTPMSSAYKIN